MVVIFIDLDGTLILQKKTVTNRTVTDLKRRMIKILEKHSIPIGF